MLFFLDTDLKIRTREKTNITDSLQVVKEKLLTKGIIVNSANPRIFFHILYSIILYFCVVN